MADGQITTTTTETVSFITRPKGKLGDFFVPDTLLVSGTLGALLIWLDDIPFGLAFQMCAIKTLQITLSCSFASTT